MAYDFKSEDDVKEFINNLGIEYRFGCYSEKKPEVCHLLGDYLEAISKDFPKAAKIFKNNCDEYNYGKSCYKYGNYSLLGKDGRKEDYKTALKYFQKACKLEENNACFTEGLLYVTNNETSGINQDILKGMPLLEKACTGGNANACYFLSGMYISGVRKPHVKAKHGEDLPADSYQVKKDMETAFKYALRGCNLGNVYSCVNVSQMYKRGEGVDKNIELSEKYRKEALEIQSEMQSQKTLTFQEGLS